MRGAGRWQSGGAYPASISHRSLGRPVPLPLGRKAQAFCSAPLIPVVERGRSGREVGRRRPFVAWLCAWPVTPPRMAGFFMGPWGAVPGCFGCLCRTRCARVPGLQIASHNVPYRQNHPPKERQWPRRRQKTTGERGVSAAGEGETSGSRNDERGGRATPSHLVPAETGSGHGQARAVSATHIAITAACYNGTSQRYVATFTSRGLLGVDFAGQTLRSG